MSTESAGNPAAPEDSQGEESLLSAASPQQPLHTTLCHQPVRNSKLENILPLTSAEVLCCPSNLVGLASWVQLSSAGAHPHLTIKPPWMGNRLPWNKSMCASAVQPHGSAISRVLDCV